MTLTRPQSLSRSGGHREQTNTIHQNCSGTESLCGCHGLRGAVRAAYCSTSCKLAGKRSPYWLGAGHSWKSLVRRQRTGSQLCRIRIMENKQEMCCNPLLDCFLCNSRSLLLAVLCLFWPYMGPWGPPLARHPSQPIATLQQNVRLTAVSHCSLTAKARTQGVIPCVQTPFTAGGLGKNC